MKVVIIGGNGAGMSAASRIKRKFPETDVTVFEKTSEVSYGACGLPYYISGENPDVDLVRIRKAEKFIESGVDLRLRCAVERIDLAGKTVDVLDQASGAHSTAGYDKLVIASGAGPIVPPVPGIALPNIFTLKSIEDAERIRARLSQSDVRRVAVIGGGYIGLEVAESCIRLGKETIHVFEAAPYCLTSFDPEFGAAAKAELERNGVQVHVGEAVSEAYGDGALQGVKTTLGGQYDLDMAIVAIGVRPNTGFLLPGQLDQLKNGAIVVDTAMRTSVPDVYAAGDCCTVTHRITGAQTYIPLATNANKQGRLVGDSVMGLPVDLRRALGTSMLRCAGLEFARTGLNEREAAAAGIPVKSATISAKTHARYYPGSAPITIKLICHRDTDVVLGAQLMGEAETAWRVDVFACAIDRGMTAGELAYLDLAYCPIFSTVWDPILTAANVVK